MSSSESLPQPRSVSQLEANVAHELSNLLNVVSACGDRLASSPEVAVAARLDLLALAGRVAHAIIDARRRGISLRRWLGVNATLRHLEAAVRLLLPASIDVTLDLDPQAGSVHLAPGELDLVILNLLLDARARLGDSGHFAIRSMRVRDGGREAIAIFVEDQPREAQRWRAAPGGAQFGLATVRLITRDADGDVELRPHPSGGFSVRLLLPARPNAAD